MGRSLVQQPDGKLAIFSTIVDDFVMTDATEKEIVNALVSEFRKRTKIEVANTVKLLNGGKMQDCYPYYTRGEVTWAECEKERKRVHGKKKS